MKNLNEFLASLTPLLTDIYAKIAADAQQADTLQAQGNVFDAIKLREKSHQIYIIEGTDALTVKLWDGMNNPYGSLTRLNVLEVQAFPTVEKFLEENGEFLHMLYTDHLND